ncbi:eukaryotic translation initiation factor 3 subunit E [Helicobacter pylori]|uniref:eukaryotic translation initiation factor 3 subunit E n=1 Tax=Helicobacter pylori TaxID=210 RepID=UPI00215A03D1|nr:eukaryotic translation initiation factor 3 subunit E [Helicobacter pylori]
MFGKSSNDTQENPKDALKKEEVLKKVQEVQEENAKIFQIPLLSPPPIMKSF